MKKSNYIGKTFLGKYKILKLIGKGGMDSSIFLADDLSSNENTYLSYKYKYAAIKIIEKSRDTSDDQWQKILDEGTTTGRLLEKKNIVKLYDFSTLDNNTILIAMEFIDGLTLQKYIIENGAIPLNESIYIFEQVLIGVKELHNNTNIIIHRDLKPENILISKDLSKIKIIDFGISSVLEKTKEKFAKLKILTNEESFYGTIPYLTPDILNFSNQPKENIAYLITKQFDFHSLGVILYEMIMGKKPFFYENDEDPKSIRLPQEYDIPPMKLTFKDFPSDIENIIIRLMASKENDYGHRYSSIEEVIEDVNKYKLRIRIQNPEPHVIKKSADRRLQFPAKFNIKNELKKRNYKWVFIFYWLVFITAILLLGASLIFLWVI
ncbi:MAG: serine/threonine-protein kinase [Mycoplasmoidaceae bacterium]